MWGMRASLRWWWSYFLIHRLGEKSSTLSGVFWHSYLIKKANPFLNVLLFDALLSIPSFLFYWDQQKQQYSFLFLPHWETNLYPFVQNGKPWPLGLYPLNPTKGYILEHKIFVLLVTKRPQEFIMRSRHNPLPRWCRPSISIGRWALSIVQD